MKIELLKEVGFDGEKSKKLVNTCSGGEKQRVALVRSIINNPKIILADEPTGALDSTNSRAVMEILKKFSKKHLVIVVTHNRDLAYEFSDRVLLMDSSSIKTVTLKEIPKEEINNTPTHTKRNGNWVTYFVEKNLKKRFKRNLISIISLAVSLIFTFVLFGFINGSGKEISAQSVQQFDLGVSTISIQNKTEIENRFGFLVNAFKYGVPPHGGMAIGLDRLCMLMLKRKNIRDVIAFPKVQSSADLMSNAPSRVSESQLKELSIQSIIS